MLRRRGSTIAAISRLAQAVTAQEAMDPTSKDLGRHQETVTGAVETTEELVVALATIAVRGLM